MRLVIPAGTRVYFGRPARAAPSELVDSLKGLVACFSEISEAHLPQCWVQGVMSEPAQILVVLVPNQSHKTDELAARMESKIAALLPYGFHLDLWIMCPDEPALSAVRNAGCSIMRAE